MTQPDFIMCISLAIVPLGQFAIMRKINAEFTMLIVSLQYYYALRIIFWGVPLSHPSLDYIRLAACFCMIQGIFKVNLYMLGWITTFLLILPLKSVDFSVIQVPLFLLANYIGAGSNIEVLKWDNRMDFPYYKRLWILNCGLVYLYPFFLIFEFYDQIDVSKLKAWKPVSHVEVPRDIEDQLSSTLGSDPVPEMNAEDNYPQVRTVLDKIYIPNEAEIKSYEI